MTSAARATIGLLAEAGVRRFYTVPGESFLELMDEVERDRRLTLVSTRHESGAAFMAEADGKLTGIPAVAMATRAVGAANLAIGVHTAHQDSTPMVVLLGQVETQNLGREAFQEVDLPQFYSEITRYAATVHRSERAAETVAQALRVSLGPRPGPAMVALPSDILAGPSGTALQRPVGLSRPSPPPQEISAVAELLAAAERPVALVGEGMRDGHDELTALAERYGVGVYTAFRRQDAFPNSHPHYLGHLTLGAPDDVLAPMRDADLVLVLGSRLDEVTTQGYTLPAPGVAVVQVDACSETLGAVVPLRRGVHAHPAGFVRALVEYADRQGLAVERDWSKPHERFEVFSDPESIEQGADWVHPAAVLGALRRHASEDALIVNDAGNFSVFGHRYWRFEHPRTQVAPISGAMGYAVPASVAASLVAPQRQVIALAGDGGFLMTGQELETAVRVGADPFVVVFQNGLYATIAMHQARSLGRTTATRINHVDIAGYATSLGAQPRTVREPSELDEAVASLLHERGPRVLVVHTDPDVLTPTATLSGLLGGAG